MNLHHISTIWTQQSEVNRRHKTTPQPQPQPQMQFRLQPKRLVRPLSWTRIEHNLSLFKLFLREQCQQFSSLSCNDDSTGDHGGCFPSCRSCPTSTSADTFLA